MSDNSKNQGNPDFDWDSIGRKGFGYGYSSTEREQLENLYEGTLSPIQEKEVVKDTVVCMTDSDVIVHTCFKSDGIVTFDEFRENPNLKIGDEVEVFIESQENAQGQLELTSKKAKVITAWRKIHKYNEEDL